MQEDSKWLNDFYQEVNAGKRMELWQKHGCTEQTEGDTFREQLLYARYGKKKKKEEQNLKFLPQRCGYIKHFQLIIVLDFLRDRPRRHKEHGLLKDD